MRTGREVAACNARVIASRENGQCVTRITIPMVSAAAKQSPTIHTHFGARRCGVVAGGRSISTFSVLQFWGLFLIPTLCGAQSWDLGSRLADYVPSHTGGQLR